MAKERNAMTGSSRDLDDWQQGLQSSRLKIQSSAFISHSCKYQLAGHLVARAKDSHHLIEFTVKILRIWNFSIPPLGRKNEKKILCPVR